MILPKTRKAAMDQGVKFYQTDKLCLHGHQSKRHTLNGACCKCLVDQQKIIRQAFREKVAENRGSPPFLKEEKSPHTPLKEENIQTPPPPDDFLPINSKEKIKIPYQEIVDLYHKVLPELPTCRKLNAVRKSYIKGRWLDDGMGSIDEWKGFFGEIRPSNFLMGKAEPQSGRPPFIATLEWMTKPANFNKICEGMYHRG